MSTIDSSNDVEDLPGALQFQPARQTHGLKAGPREPCFVCFGRGGRDGSISPDGTLVAAGDRKAGDTAVWKIILESR